MNHPAKPLNVVRLDEYRGARQQEDRAERQSAQSFVLRKLSEEPPGHAIVCSVGVGMDPNGNVRKFVTGVYPEDTKQLIDALLDVVEILAQWGRGEDPGESQPPEAKVK